MTKPRDDPYTKYDKEDMILRDWLATDRTILANERTFLAYIRTAFAVFIVVVGLLYYSPSGVVVTLAYLILPFGALLFFYGFYRFLKTQNALKELMEGRKKH